MLGCALFCLWAGAGLAQTIVFADNRLEELVRGQLGKLSGETLTVEDMSSLTGLSGASRGIRELGGMEWATNLTELTLDNNVITGVAPLGSLTRLSRLSLAGNQVSDLSALVNLKGLVSLNLSYNPITNPSVLSAVTGLSQLYLPGDAMQEIGFLTNLTGLSWLNLGENRIRDVSALGGLTNLNYLVMSQNPVTNWAGIAGLERLVNVELRSCGMSNVDFLGGLTNLAYADLAYNDIRDTSVLPNAADLNLVLDGNTHLELGSISNQTNLARLWVNGVLIHNLLPLSGLTNLLALGVEGAELTEIDPLTNCTQLMDLGISRNAITNLEPLSALHGLTGLRVDGLGLRDIGPLTNLSRLQFLSCISNRIETLEPFKSLTNLGSFYAAYNRLTNLAGVEAMTGLRYVDVSQNLFDTGVEASRIENVLAAGIALKYLPTDDLNLAFDFFNSIWHVPTGRESTLRFHVSDHVVPIEELSWNLSTSDSGIAGDLGIHLDADGGELYVVPSGAGTVTNVLTVWNAPGGMSRSATVVMEAGVPDSAFSISDAGVSNRIYVAVGSPGRQLTSVDVLGIENLDLSGLGATNLTGIEWLKNLNRLNASGNPGVTLGSIQELTVLEWLKLAGDALTNLDEIAGLTNLTYLDLSGNLMTNFEAVSGLTNLVNLFLVGNRIEDVGFLNNLKSLVYLDLATNRLVDVSEVAGLTNLSWVRLEQNRLRNLDLLTNLTGLTYIDGRLNVLAVGTDPALDQLGSMALLLADPQREVPFLDIRTNWVNGWNGPSPLFFNIFDSGPADEVLGVGISVSGLEVSFNLRGPLVDGTWQLMASPVVPPAGSNLVIQVTLRATNDVGLLAEKLVTVTLAPLTVVDADLLGDTNLTWRSNGDAPWFGQGLMTHEGHAVAQSGVVPNFGFSALETDLMGPGRLRFWWKVSSEENYDWLTFSIGEQTEQISGEGDWERKMVNVPPGLQTARWEYRKDNDASHGLDAGWVDQVRFEPGVWMEPPISGDGGVTILFHGVPGRVYELLSSTNWAEWNRITPAVLATNTSQTLSDTNKAEGSRLYQLHELF
jgi:Leucine-rich repeat (LRR) protein